MWWKTQSSVKYLKKILLVLNFGLLKLSFSWFLNLGCDSSSPLKNKSRPRDLPGGNRGVRGHGFWAGYTSEVAASLVWSPCEILTNWCCEAFFVDDLLCWVLILDDGLTCWSALRDNRGCLLLDTIRLKAHGSNYYHVLVYLLQVFPP